MNEPSVPDISIIRGVYPERAERMALPGGFDGPVPHYGETVDGREAWAMYRAAAAGDLGLVNDLVVHNPTLVNIQNWYEFPIYMAVRNDHVEVVRALLSAGADPGLSNYLYSSWQTPLQIARDRGFRDVYKVLEEELKVRYNYHQDFYKLRDAVKERDSKTVEAVLQDNAHLAISADEFGASALHWAALTRQLPLIDRFLELGADIDACRAGGDTPLHLAIDGDYWFHKEGQMGRAIKTGSAVAGYLLARGADYFLTIACVLGDQERVEAILADDAAAAKMLDSARNSPLHFAAREGHTQIVKLLLDAGADPNQMEALTTGGRALFEASAGNHLETARLLLDRGANPTVGVDSSGTALTIVEHTHPGRCSAMQELLRSYGAEDEAWVMTPEQRAQKLADDPEAAYDAEMIKHILRSNDAALVDTLLSRNPDAFRHLSGEGVTSLPDDPTLAKRIIDGGINVDQRDSSGKTMLWHHAGKGHLETVKLLIDYGADINILDALEGRSPLASAAAGGHEDVVGFLLSSGAETHLADGPWATPAACARRAELHDLATLLEE